MRRIAVILLLAVVASAAEVVPAKLPNPRTPYPLWISQRLATNDRGELDYTQFDSASTAMLKQLIAANDAGRANSGRAADDCYAYSTRPPAHYAPTDTVDDLIRGAHVIIAGRVTAVEPGFYAGRPGSMIAISARSADVVSDLPDGDSARYLLFYPRASMRFANGTVCARPREDALVPAVGDRVLAFSIDTPFLSGPHAVIFADAVRELVVARGDRLAAPASLRGIVSGKATFDRLRERVMRRVEEGNGRLR